MDRKDSWSLEDDQLLAEIIINTISSGNTQLTGFDRASETLRRTSAACGFRWNSYVRKLYNTEIREAKTIKRVNKKISLKTKRPSPPIDEITIDKVLLSLLNIKQDYEYLKHKVQEQNTIIQEYELKNRVHSSPETLTEDMKRFLQILRKSSTLDKSSEINEKEPAI